MQDLFLVFILMLAIVADRYFGPVSSPFCVSSFHRSAEQDDRLKLSQQS